MDKRRQRLQTPWEKFVGNVVLADTNASTT
jgi:hypothetical protein